MRKEAANMSQDQRIQRIIAGRKHGDTESFLKLVVLCSNRCHGFFCPLSGSRDISDELPSGLFAVGGRSWYTIAGVRMGHVPANSFD